MKLPLALFAAICITGVYSVDENANPARAECIQETKVDINLFQEWHKNPETFVPTREMQCYVACLLKKKNLMDASGKYTKVYEDTELNEECKPEYGNDECETAGKLMACINQHDLMDKAKANVEYP